MAQRRSAEEIQQILERYRASGLSQMEYCRQTGTVLSTLGRYLRQIDRPEQQLVRVKVEAPPEPGTGFVLTLGNGRPSPAAGDSGIELARLIRVAESA
jgi:hypothetical protein